MTKDEAEKIDHIKANDARMQDEVNKTLLNKENNKYCIYTWKQRTTRRTRPPRCWSWR